MYTRCPQPDFCPLMDRNFAAVQNAIKKTPGARRRAARVRQLRPGQRHAGRAEDARARRFRPIRPSGTSSPASPMTSRAFAAKFGVTAEPSDESPTDPHSQPEHRGHRCRRHAREDPPGQHVDAGRPHCRSQSGSRSRALTRRRRRGCSFTAAERRSSTACASPLAVQRWLNALPYNNEKGGETLRSFRGVVRHGTAHCLEAALSAAVDPRAASLSAARPELRVDRPARSRDLRLSRGRPDGDRWRVRATPACTAASRCSRRRARWRSATSSRTSTSPAASRPTRSSICACSATYDWRLSEKNVWKVEQMLLDWPHRRIDSSKARERRWRVRYRAFREAHGYKPWKFYPRRDRWTELPRTRSERRG